MRTKPSDNTTTVDRELARVYRRLRDEDARQIGKLHAAAGHKGTARNCRRCRAELQTQRERAITAITIVEPTEAAAE